MQSACGRYRLPDPEPAVVVRRTQLYCVGTAKSGTHSIAAMLTDQVRAQHEPQAELLIHRILEISAGRISREALADWIRARDRDLNLEVDSSQLNFFILDVLLREFAGARFLLTIRDCYSWLESLINHSLASPASGPWTELRNLRFKPERFTHSPQEAVLKNRGLYTLDGYLSYWAEHNSKVLRIVPPERLLVVRTDRISAKACRIAEFAGLPPEAIQPGRAHAFKGVHRSIILEELDRAYLESKVDRHCRPLMARFFPEFASFDDRRAASRD